MNPVTSDAIPYVYRVGAVPVVLRGACTAAVALVAMVNWPASFASSASNGTVRDIERTPTRFAVLTRAYYITTTSHRARRSWS